MRKREIERWTTSLVGAYGKPRPPVNITPFRSDFLRGDYTKLVTGVSRNMKLEMGLRIGYVRSGGPRTAPAWVTIPSNIPMIGTESFRRWTAEIHIRNSFLKEAPFESVLSVLSHEFAHILLSSSRHSLAQVEEVVDLTAMFLGYRDVFVGGAEYLRMASLETATRLLERNMTLGSFLNTALSLEVLDELSPQGMKLGYMSTEEYEFARKLLAHQR